MYMKRWQDYAACRSMDTEWFFDDAEEDANIENASKQVCAVCLVKDICLKQGIKGKEFGIWGGEMLKDGKLVDRC